MGKLFWTAGFNRWLQVATKNLVATDDFLYRLTSRQKTLIFSIPRGEGKKKILLFVWFVASENF